MISAPPRQRRRGIITRSILALTGMLVAAGVAAPLAAGAADESRIINDADLGDADFTFSYSGPWDTSVGVAGDHNGDEHWTNSRNWAQGELPSYSIAFTGTGIKIYGTKAPGHGINTVSVDGSVVKEFDAYAATRQSGQVLVELNGLPAAPHIVKVQATGRKTGTAPDMQVDYAEISGVTPPKPEPDRGPALIPTPNSVVSGSGPSFAIRADTPIVADAGATPVATYLAALVKPATGFTLAVDDTAGDSIVPPIVLSTTGDASLGREGYALTVTGGGVRIEAHTAEGVFRGVTTLRQLLPAQIESQSVVSGAWQVRPVTVTDAPRFSFRGVMLDPARRFVPVKDIKRFIDQASMYKYNVLHLHLTDDQGWRIAIDALPQLTAIGATTQSGYAPGTPDPEAPGPWYYSKADYAEIVQYAADRYIEVIPEIDGPGHTTAALASIPGLNCDDRTKAPYSGFDVNISFVCVSDAQHQQNVRTWLTNVLTEVAAQTPGRYLHLGGDETKGLGGQNGFQTYAGIANTVATGTGKKIMAWQDWMAGGTPPAGTILQYWGTASAGDAEKAKHAEEAVAAGLQLVSSPADRAYLDMKYDRTVPYGRSWAAIINLQRAYSWDPTVIRASNGSGNTVFPDTAIIGVEAAIWSDSANQFGDRPVSQVGQYAPARVYTDYMAFPRLPATAEIGWSTQIDRTSTAAFTDFRNRIIDTAVRWDVMGIGYYRAPDVTWKAKGSAAPLPPVSDLKIDDRTAGITFDSAAKGMFRAGATFTGTGQVLATQDGVASDPIEVDGTRAFTVHTPAKAANTVGLIGVDSNGAQSTIPLSLSRNLGVLTAPKTAKPGQSITVSGTGFGPHEAVTHRFAAEPLAPTAHAAMAAAGIVTDASGGFTMKIRVPEGAKPGDVVIVAGSASTDAAALTTVIAKSDPGGEGPGTGGEKPIPGGEKPGGGGTTPALPATGTDPGPAATAAVLALLVGILLTGLTTARRRSSSSL